MLGVCGLNCGACDIYMACRGDEVKMKEILDWFREKRGLDLKPEQVRCDGCTGDLSRHWSKDCKMMLCARERGVKLCSDCPDFLCPKLEAFANDSTPHHRRSVENLRRIREMGLDAWLREQDHRGPPVFCP